MLLVKRLSVLFIVVVFAFSQIITTYPQGSGSVSSCTYSAGGGVTGNSDCTSIQFDASAQTAIGITPQTDAYHIETPWGIASASANTANVYTLSTPGYYVFDNPYISWTPKKIIITGYTSEGGKYIAVAVMKSDCSSVIETSDTVSFAGGGAQMELTFNSPVALTSPTYILQVITNCTTCTIAINNSGYDGPMRNKVSGKPRSFTGDVAGSINANVITAAASCGTKTALTSVSANNPFIYLLGN